MSKLRPIYSLLIAVAVCPLAACAKEAASSHSGHFQAGDNQHTIVDAIAYRDRMDQTRVVFSDVAYDRVAFARDAEIDLLDFMRHDGATLELQFDDSGTLVALSTSADGNHSMNMDDGLRDKVELSVNDGSQIVGRFTLEGQHQVRFDLPVHSNPFVYEPGSPLPADGGAPGAALLAMVQAVHQGDLDTLLENAGPEQAEQMREAIANGEAESMLAMAQAFTPRAIEITGGREDGDRAWVQFRAGEAEDKVSGSAELSRQSGRWFVRDLSTQAGN